MDDRGEFLTIEIVGMEYDWGPGDDDPLGRQSLRLSRDELLMLGGGSNSRVMPLPTGDDSGYAVTVKISVS